MGYVPLNNYNYDSGYRRIQSGPNHQGFIVLTSGSSAYGVNEGIVVPGSPLSGTIALGTWDYDSNWRYVPSTLPGQSGSLDPTPYNVSGALDTYNAARIYTRDNVAGAQAASAIGPETGKVNPRGAALQPRANVTRPEKYMYFGGGAPDNQDYSPYNTPDANTAAEGKTGGGVTHRNYESSLLTNLLGSQGTSDRSQWRYHQPVYCKTFTETQRSATPGLMSSPLRYIYRGSATSYNYNYGGELLANKGGFELLPYDDQTFGCPFPVGCPIKTGLTSATYTGDVFTAVIPCNYLRVDWYNTGSNVPIGNGLSYTVKNSDIGYKIYFIVTYFDNSTDSSSADCFNTVELNPVSLNQDFFVQYVTTPTNRDISQAYPTYYDNDGTAYCIHKPNFSVDRTYYPIITCIAADRQSVLWSVKYTINDGYSGEDSATGESFSMCADNNYLYLFISRLNTSDYRKTRLHLLTLRKTDGEVISDEGAEFTNTTTTPIAGIRENGNVQSAITDGFNNFWLIFSPPVNIDQCTTIASLTKTGSGLSVNWTYVLALKNNNTGAITTRTDRAITMSLEVKSNNVLKIGPYGTSTYLSVAGASLTLINMYTGVIQKRAEFFITENTATADYTDSTIDDDGNEYYTHFDTLSYTIQTKFYITKRSSSGSFLWVKDYNSNLDGVSIRSPSMYIEGSKLIICVEYLVGGVLPLHYVVLYTINKETGDLERSTRAAPPVTPSNSWTQLFKNPKLAPWKVNGEYIIQDGVGYRVPVNVSGIPIPFYSGGAVNSLTSNTPSGYYVFTERSTSGVRDVTVISGAGNIAPVYDYTDFGTITSFLLDPVNITAANASGEIQYRFITKLA